MLKLILWVIKMILMIKSPIFMIHEKLFLDKNFQKWTLWHINSFVNCFQGKLSNFYFIITEGHAAAGFGYIDPFELFRSFFSTGDPFNAFDHLGVVVMHAKMVKSIARVCGAEKTCKQFKGINESKTVFACCTVTSWNNKIKTASLTVLPLERRHGSFSAY